MERYNNAKIRIKDNKNYYKSKFYPNIPLSSGDMYIITSSGDRLDTLAHSYYGDVELWWVIAMANNNINKGALYLQPGTQLRIPTNISLIEQTYNKFNQSR